MVEVDKIVLKWKLCIALILVAPYTHILKTSLQHLTGVFLSLLVLFIIDFLKMFVLMKNQHHT